MITSPTNSTIKEIRRLRDRSARQASGLAYVEGIRQVIEAGKGQDVIERVVYCDTLLTSSLARDWLKQAQRSGTPVLEVNADVFSRLAMKESPVGLAAVVRQKWSALPGVLAPADVWVALDAIADPGNLGTILRTLDASAGMGVILLDASTDPYDPTSIRASMGAVFTKKLVRTTLPVFSDWIDRHRISLIGASDRGAQDYYNFPYPSPCVIMLGSERHGLSEAHLALCRQVVAIPMSGNCDSLNLAVAASLILYEIYNQRRLSGGAKE
ncbi:MAG: RNA methyltransferase [Anaerolineae bacterium]|nr:RNA methyltransferase [Anaerolineae bacterium]